MATERPLEAMGLAKDGKLRMGRVAGLGGLLTLLTAASELNDPTESAGRNLAQAAGVAGGGLAGGALGGAAAGFLGGGPIGLLAGATIGSVLGGMGGRGATTAGMDWIEGSPEQRALQQAKKMADAQLEIDTERLRTLMPIQDAAAQMAIANEVKRAEAMSGLMNEQRLRDTMAAALLQQSQAAGVQQQGLTQAILGGLV
jgi:hypothetical protein